MRGMKLALAVVAAVAGCTDSQAPSSNHEDPALVEICGRPPQLPPLSYAGGSTVAIAMPVWNAHTQWVSDVNGWARCADASKSVIAACMKQPPIPPWSYVANPDGTPSVIVGGSVWMEHIAWVTATVAWTICADATNPD